MTVKKKKTKKQPKHTILEPLLFDSSAIINNSSETCPADSCVPINKYIKRDINQVGEMAQLLKRRFTIKKKKYKRYVNTHGWSLRCLPSKAFFKWGWDSCLLECLHSSPHLSVMAQRHRSLLCARNWWACCNFRGEPDGPKDLKEFASLEVSVIS